MLVPQIRICSAGQFPLKNMQIKASGWEELIRNVQLHPLNKVDVKRYARIKGIEDPQELDEIERFSAGVPLALSLSCDLVLQHGAEKLKDSSVSRETIGQLVGKLLEDMNNDFFFRRFWILHLSSGVLTKIFYQTFWVNRYPMNPFGSFANCRFYYGLRERLEFA